MPESGPATRWVLTCALTPAGLLTPEGRAALRAAPGLAVLWRAVDGSCVRAYCDSATRPAPAWQPLQPLQSFAGASQGQAAPFHYVVETDVLPEHADMLNAWYAQEHLPGLAGVPGTVHAARYRRLDGAPEYYACYDLTSLDTLQTDAWLAVRHTDWSSRVRPLFRNTARTGFAALPDAERAGLGL